jgi:hypothetical protein
MGYRQSGLWRDFRNAGGRDPAALGVLLGVAAGVRRSAAERALLGEQMQWRRDTTRGGSEEEERREEEDKVGWVSGLGVWAGCLGQGLGCLGARTIRTW